MTWSACGRPPANARGLLLAAGAGQRLGRPKALVRDAAGTAFLDRSLRALLDAGCAGATVVLGARAGEARALIVDAGWGEHPGVEVVEALDWAEGMGASLRAGLRALSDPGRGGDGAGGGAGALPAGDGVGDGAGAPPGGDVEAVLVTLVDLPDVGAEVLGRVLRAGSGPGALVRATYEGRPGHPVLIGRDHWAGVVSAASGDRGARGYLAAHEHAVCECADLASGRDVDRPQDLDSP